MNLPCHAIGLLALVAIGCSSSSSSNVCTPGISVACTGSGGCAGDQACNGAGSGYGACTCQPLDSGQADAAADANASDANASDHSVPDANDGATAVKRVFLLNKFLSGDLATQGGGSGSDPGAAGADALCNQDAAKYSLGGSWNAWISTSMVDAQDHLAGVGPWYLVDETTLVANSISDLTTSGPANAINMFGDGTVDTLGLQTWTGTAPDGTLSSDNTDCSDWTSSSGSVVGRVGDDLVTTSDWTLYSVGAPLCSNSLLSLYCFEQ